ncbi:MAG: hypothetical protein B9J98_06400 [Candidatus Terraquivivens tikiterensis]|uniref:DUF2095 domain-containing protein n=1 Tax=Candidatus Terraquivivens tikiterensis TaxID=1980982 RepID=A0A2R7Y1H0_9ARCH|nr:MAG: hypothetical protein B9J98_06400 [Candidatus Terraquivivens tikiterensis]
MIDFEIEEFRRRFPNLYREIVQKKMSIRIDAQRDSEERAEEAMNVLRGGLPGPVDYIRRCDTDEEAIKLVDYLESRGEVTKEEADRLRKQIAEMGVRSFGPKKELGYYSKFIR